MSSLRVCVPAVRLLMVAIAARFAAGCADSGPAQPEIAPPVGDTSIAIPRDTNDVIYIGRTDGSNAIRVTAGSQPAWAPSGDRIAFDRNGSIYIVNVDGNDETRLVAGRSPAWSPDGTRIAFRSSEGISIIDVNGTNPVTIIRHDFRTDTYAPWDMGVDSPSWSPDGTRIAFEHLGDGDVQPAQAFVMNADGTEPRLLTVSVNGGRFAESAPSWSPDGNRLACWHYGLGIAVVDRASGAPRSAFVEPTALPYGARPVWSSNGTTLLFTAFTSDPPRVMAVPANGGSPTLILEDAYDAVWSPGDDRIAFVSRRGG